MNKQKGFIGGKIPPNSTKSVNEVLQEIYPCWDDLVNKYLHKKCFDVSNPENIGEIIDIEFVWHSMSFRPILKLVVKFEDGTIKRFSKASEFELVEDK